MLAGLAGALASGLLKLWLVGGYSLGIDPSKGKFVGGFSKPEAKAKLRLEAVCRIEKIAQAAAGERLALFEVFWINLSIS